MKVRVSAKDAAVRLNVSYVVAAGLLSHLEEQGKAVVVEKKFHASGKGKPTRIYEVDQQTVLDFSLVASVAEVATEPVVADEPVAEPGDPVVVPVEPVAEVESEEESGMPEISTMEHVTAALERLKAAQDAEAA